MFFAVLTSSCTQNEPLEAVRELNRMLGKKSEINAIKNQRIANILKTQSINELTLEQEYAINDRLYLEYNNYHIDSAIRYCEKNIVIAQELGDKNRETEQVMNLAYLYTIRGNNLDASLLLDKIRPNLPERMRILYYQTRINAYETRSNRYTRRLTNAYKDSISMISPAIVETDEQHLKRLYAGLHLVDPATPEYALKTYYLALWYELHSKIDSAKHYYALSSIADIRSSNKNSGSMVRLAHIYYNEGKFSQAYRIAQSVADDSSSGNIYSRAINVSSIYSIIVDSYHKNEKKTMLYIYICLGTICGLLLALIVLLTYVYKQVIRLRLVQSELTNANAQLMIQNDKLKDYNTVREHYIAHFLEMISILITKMDNYRNSLRKLAVNDKRDELMKRLKSNSMLENELNDLYNEFDSVFLDLYPSFVEDFNAMLKPDEKMHPKPDEKMNTELRIFALMRLGITNGDEISRFLHCSRSTVYTYRTKILNQSAISREEFEAALPTFGTGSK